MISFGSLELVVFIDQVNLRDLGLTSEDSLTTLALETLVLPPGVRDLSTPMVWPWLPAEPTLRLPSMPVVGISSYRLLNFDDNFEKKDVLAEFNADVSCEDSGTPYWLEGAGLLALVCPAWKVDLAGTWRWKAAGPLVAGPGDTADIFRLCESLSAALALATASLLVMVDCGLPDPALMEALFTCPWLSRPRSRGVASGPGCAGAAAPPTPFSGSDSVATVPLLAVPVVDVRLEFRESPSKAFVLSVEEHFSWGSIADRLLAAAATATPRPVALDMVLDLVMPRALGEVGVLESEAELEALEDELEVRPPVLGRDGVVADMRDSLLALMVAESTVFCRLKLEVVV